MKDLLEYLDSLGIGAGNIEGEDAWAPDCERPSFLWVKSGVEDVTDRAYDIWGEIQRLKRLPEPEDWRTHYDAIHEQWELLDAECPVGWDKFECVLSVGGGEGEGEYVERVWKHLPSGKYLRATASYYSYTGICGWEPLEYVVPVENTITVINYVEENP